MGHSLQRAVLGAATLLAITAVTSAAPPGEVNGFGACGANRECLAWSSTAGAASYRIYRGAASDLANLANNALDVCDRGTFYGSSTGGTIPDSPLPGDLYWYLITATNNDGEGAVGEATFGPRIVNSRGSCALACDPNYAPDPNRGTAAVTENPNCPPGMVLVTTFCIDRYEASLVDDASGAPWSPYLGPAAGHRYRAVSAKGAIPQGYVSGSQAQSACANAGKRLCTDAEWLRACRGPFAFTYPYGNARIAGACNDERSTTPVQDYFGPNPQNWDTSQRCLNQMDNTVDPTGAHPSCVTTEGVYDMVGNLLEWTADPAGTYRGGWYVNATLNGAGCLYATTAHEFTYHDYSTGFRCCAESHP